MEEDPAGYKLKSQAQLSYLADFLADRFPRPVDGPVPDFSAQCCVIIPHFFIDRIDAVGYVIVINVVKTAVHIVDSVHLYGSVSSFNRSVIIPDRRRNIIPSLPVINRLHSPISYIPIKHIVSPVQIVVYPVVIPYRAIIDVFRIVHVVLVGVASC